MTLTQIDGQLSRVAIMTIRSLDNICAVLVGGGKYNLTILGVHGCQQFITL